MQENQSQQSFYGLTPDHILEAVEQAGLRSTGRCFALNSLENRVYEVELEEEYEPVQSSEGFALSIDKRKLVGKFYRPHRWSREGILEEHGFLADLAAGDIPVVCPLPLKGGDTLAETETGIHFAVFPKVRGRAPEELQDDQLLQIGRLIARLHTIGSQKVAKHRPTLTPELLGAHALKFLIDNNWIAPEVSRRYQSVVEEIIKKVSSWFTETPRLRIHGDCHLGNLLYNRNDAFFLDFDDTMNGPAVQDLWLLIGGQDEVAQHRLEVLLKGYDQMKLFDRKSLRLIAPLRAFRIVHYSAWIARRWSDPAFPRVFSEFNTHNYWAGELEILEKLLFQVSES